MDHRIVVAGFLVYLPVAWVILQSEPSRWRDFRFTILNIAGLAFTYQLGKMNLAIYLLIVLGEFFLLRRKSRWAGWFPVWALVIVRYLPGNWLGLPLAIPVSEFLVGYSYLAFRQISLYVEVSNGFIACPTIWQYLGFSFFVPIMSVGPISRYEGFFPERRPTLHAAIPGLERLLVGMVKFLFFGSLLSRFTYDALFGNGGSHGGGELLVSGIGYYLFLYCNFSGFCDMAVGSGMILGITVEENFASPFLARNVKDFWNRWHITLSNFMRDLVFTPVSRFLVGRWGVAYVNLSLVLSLFLVFTLIGLWHGFDRNYLIFGLLNGAAVATNHFYGLFLKRRLSPSQFLAYQQNGYIRYLAIAATFLFVSTSLFFFANRPDSARLLVEKLGF